MTTAANAPVLAVPDDLTERDQFVPWRREVVGGRETKVTYSVRGVAGERADDRSSRLKRFEPAWGRRPIHCGEVRDDPGSDISGLQAARKAGRGGCIHRIEVGTGADNGDIRQAGAFSARNRGSSAGTNSTSNMKEMYSP